MLYVYVHVYIGYRSLIDFRPVCPNVHNRERACITKKNYENNKFLF